MKNFLFVIWLALSFVAFSCTKKDNEKSSKQTEDKISTKFAVDSIELKDSAKIAENLSVNYSAKMLVFPTLKNRNLLDSIYYYQKDITDYSKDGLNRFLEKDKTDFFGSVREKSKEWIEDISRAQTWETGSFMKLISQSEDFLQIEYLFTSYEGGAHGNYAFNTRVFDLKNNKKIELKDITAIPKARLEELLMKNIDKIPSGTTDSEGAVKNSEMLLVDVIPANENFYFDTKNLYFHYSPYEIAAFAAGDIIIPVSWKDLEGTLHPEFKKRFKIK